MIFYRFVLIFGHLRPPFGETSEKNSYKYNKHNLLINN